MRAIFYDEMWKPLEQQKTDGTRRIYGYNIRHEKVKSAGKHYRLLLRTPHALQTQNVHVRDWNAKAAELLNKT
jgi:hypothetical protein